MKKSLSQVLILSAALLLASCGGGDKKSSPAAETSVPAETSVTSEGSASEPAGTSTPTGTSTPASTPTGTSTPASTPASTPSSQTSEAAVAFTGIDIIEESNKVTAKITGTISGFASADAMKMAFGLVQSEVAEGATAQYIMGSATPADADYKYVPTVTNGTFELKVDLSTVTWAGGTYTAMCGPKGHYAAVGGQQAAGITYGTGKVNAGGFRISIRSHNGTIAADELPPVAMTISKVELVEVEGVNHVIHTIGGALNTTKLSEADFLASHPYVQYEHINDGLGGGWKKNVMGSSTKTDLVTVAVEEGNALIKVDVTDLPLGGYNIKINLSGDSDVDTKMDVVINGTPVQVGTKKYRPFADSSKSAEADLYGNCGLYISHEHVWTSGDAVADLTPITCAETTHTGYELTLNSTNTPSLGSNFKMDGKKVATWNVTGIAAGEYEVYLNCHVSNGNSKENGTVGLSTGAELTDNKSSGTAVPGRYYMQAGTADPVYTDTGSKNFYQVGIGDSNMTWTSEAVIPSIMIKDGTASLKLAHTGAGYSLYIQNVRLIRKGDYVAPPKPVLAGTTPIKVECETNTTDGISSATEDGVTYLSIGAQSWPQKSATYTVNIPEAQHARFMLHARWNSAPWGSNGAAELYLDGSSTKTKGTDNDNLGQDSKGADGVWRDMYSVEFDLTAGDHTFKLTGPGGCAVDWDYFEIQQVAADEPEPEPVITHTHAWTDGTKVADVTPSECECGDKMYTMLKADADGDNDTGLKLGKNTAKYSIYDITGAIPAGTYSLELYGHCTSGGNSASKGFSDKYKFFFGTDSTTEDKISVTSTDTYGAYGWENSSTSTEFNETLLKWTNKAVISEFVVPEGATALGVIFVGSGNSAFINGIRLVYHAPAAAE